MRNVPKAIIILWMTIWIILLPHGLVLAATDQIQQPEAITGWEVKWGNANDQGFISEVMGEDEIWEKQSADRGTIRSLDRTKQHAGSLWTRLKLPTLQDESSAIRFENIKGTHIVIYLEARKIYENYHYNYDNNAVFLPLSVENSGDTLYIWSQNEKGWLGIQGAVEIGPYAMLQEKYIHNGLIDVILGATFVFTSLIMVSCTFFLGQFHKGLWISLCVVMGSIGVMVITYSQFLYTFYQVYGDLYSLLFDLSMLLGMPALCYFFEQIIGPGVYGIFTKLRKIQWAYSTVAVLSLFIYVITGGQWDGLYNLFVQHVVGVVLVILLTILLVGTIAKALQRNREAILLASGFGTFSLISVLELLWYYQRNGTYHLFWWKWSMVAFVISLIAILGSRFAEKHNKVLQYSKELELFNNELQRSEKMEIISELAASVAHEVRNPLQVTRGFLQLMTEQEDNKNKGYVRIALEELDRASGIITDFLTFAKPEFDHIVSLNISNEFDHIEGILVPMANLEGGKITTDIPPNLHIRGNSSKFKQAFINIIKNSIEALQGGQGQIDIWAYSQEGKVKVHVRDNGEGMSEEALSRLGEPYFSNKIKGTGLGMMVTFRIVEAMNGQISFTSTKGVGTEAVVSFPEFIE
ncbi:HAMP domain-containing histidine kinase [Paenibacillus barcinonensis]|uniref:histidine kinase n=2 Tax=Paenibacillus barcinonensis TaxID=198119 RepID=A0A2V4V995_PAEBA|nr:HAMP domain-containing sensor histidine kinase [Paenibacillus barcinonensis]PYE48562.1 signal transduction histidine kinase [Paenibacillus barcinonensis]QKS58739.1 HAMP domain-containing histidine kinase [Paenibacillus barcinonensis]